MSQTDAIRKDPHYWRSLSELHDTEEFRRFLEAEFPVAADAPGKGLDRRRFLQLMSASIALAGLSGCRWPEEQIVPFAARPAGYVPGGTQRFATALEIAGVAYPALATSQDGRPIKIDGNPDHPLSLGAASSLMQAAVLELYDPDRSRTVVRRRGRQRVGAGWEDFAALAGRLAGDLASGDGLAVLAEATTSPSVHALRDRLARALPGARWFSHEPLDRRHEAEATLAALGVPVTLVPDLAQAEVIVDLDADLLGAHPTALKNARDFARGRREDAGTPNRLYVLEGHLGVTGGMADHRIPLAPSRIPLALRCLAAELLLHHGLASHAPPRLRDLDLWGYLDHPERPAAIGAMAADLASHRGRSLVAVGPRLPRESHALALALNEALGNLGRTVRLAGLPETGAGRGAAELAELVEAMRGGRVRTLLILGGNPVYDAPADLDFAAALGRVETAIHLGLYEDETARACHWHLPRAHALESWGDLRDLAGRICLVQPLIAPLYGGKTPAEVLSAILEAPGLSAHDLTRRTFAGLFVEAGGRAYAPGSAAFEKEWRRALHDGFYGQWDDLPPRTRGGGTLRLEDEAEAPGPERLELILTADAKVLDGRFANNAWLQELPAPVSKLTWDNAAVIGPGTATELGLTDGDVVTLEWRERRLDVPVLVLPGQAPWTVAVSLGYGRTAAGRVGDGVGRSAFRLRTSDAPWGGPGVRLHRTGRTHRLACTQDHFAIDASGQRERERRAGILVRDLSRQDYAAHPEAVAHMGPHHPPLESMWREWDYGQGHRWGMAIDLSACIGCGACVVACQAENNIPVVGKEQVLNGREMHWIRIDRYFRGDADAPEVAHQPVTCVHCENAPCEQVCPVAATVHSREGLNTMVYNRCVGTRYCSNNCPYKVRRFNFFNYQKDLGETQKMAYNPEVTVRSRGVMEKCTFCVQRIQKARIEARTARRPLADGDVLPACAQTCPTEAIVFGDLNDPRSRVASLQASPRAYRILDELNIKPRTAYLARLRNPHPDLAAPSAHGAGDGHEDPATDGDDHGEHGDHGAQH